MNEPGPVERPAPQPAATDSRTNYDTLTVIALLSGLGLICWLLAELLGTHNPGERAAALGAIVGGIIGAGAAVFAVYLTITAQRREDDAKRSEDAAKIRAAVRTEVITFTRYVLGALKICEQIAGGRQIQMSEATSIGMNLIDPVVYMAVADRIALLRQPQATVIFYAEIAAAKSNLQVLQMRGAGYPLHQQPMVHVQPSDAEVVANSLITALQLARSIIADPDVQRPLDKTIQTWFLRGIDAAMESAQQTFPGAESFKAPHPGGA